MSAHRNSTSAINKITFFVVLAGFCLFSISTNVSADPNRPVPNCLVEYEKLGQPPVLKQAEKFRLSGKLFDVEKLGRAVTVIDVSPGSPAKLPELKEVTYLYVIDKNDRMVLVERFLDPGPSVEITARTKILGSHEGLRRFLLSQSSDEVLLVAAGEVVIRNGRVYAVSNGAGTYPGGTDNLNYAIGKLKNAGLKMDERTQVLDHSVNAYPDPHDLRGQPTIDAIRALNTDSKFAALVEQTRRTMKTVDGKFPDSDEFYMSAIKSTEDSEKRNEFYHAATILRHWQNPAENDVWAVHSLYKSIGEEGVRRALRALETFAAARQPLSP